MPRRAASFRTLSAAGLLAAASLALPASAASKLAYIEIDGAIQDRPTFAGGMLFAADMNPTTRDLVETFERAAADDSLEAVVLRLRAATLSGAQLEELTDAIGEFRATGKKVHLFTEIYGPGEITLGAACDEVIMQKGGGLTLPGIYMEEMFLADTLKWLGLTPDFVQVGDYKGASEAMMNSQASPAWEENINQLLDSMYEAYTGDIASGRGMTREQLEAAMNEAFLTDDAGAIRLGLVDTSLDRMNLEDHLAAKYGEDFAWDDELAPGAESGPDFASMGFFEAFGMLMESMSAPAGNVTTRDTIAVVHIDGPIMDGESSQGGLLGGPSVGSLTIRESLAEIESDDNVKGVVVRIDSPGGSAIASESIWLGLRRIAETRPVWVSVGSMAASGGYYIAVAGDRIYVTDSSIVGSIGVVGGKIAMGGLYEKAKINVTPRIRGPRAGLFGSLSAWTDEERALVRREMTTIYDLFVSRVKAGREGIDVSKTAEGRLFVGEKAIDLKMADKIGTLDDAIDELAAELSLAGGEFDVLDYPPPPSFEEMLQSAIPFASAPGVNGASAANSPAVAGTIALLREALGDRAWLQIRDQMEAMLMLRDQRVMLVSPRALIFR